ncbi:MAG TPA: PorV/PorQ family protein [bacterium]|jgi:hypothetical protein
MKSKILSVILLITAVHQSFGQGTSRKVSKAGTSAAAFLEIGVGARATAMGGAFVSIANDPTALYWNVAGTANAQRNEVFALHSEWIAETNFDFVGMVLPVGDLGKFGVSITSLSMNDLAVRTVEKPEGTGEFFGAGDLAIGLSFSKQLSDRFGVGFTAKYIRQQIWHESATGFAIDFGVMFRTDLFGGMVIGAAITNFGSKMRMSGRDLRQFHRIDDSKLGSNEGIPQNIDLDFWQLPVSFQLGVSTEIVRSENYRWLVAVDALHPSDNYESVNLGTEMSLGDLIFLRGGYQSLFLADAEGGLSLGAGIKSKMLFSRAVAKFDYAYQNRDRLETVHVFSIGIEF